MDDAVSSEPPHSWGWRKSLVRTSDESCFHYNSRFIYGAHGQVVSSHAPSTGAIQEGYTFMLGHKIRCFFRRCEILNFATARYRVLRPGRRQNRASKGEHVFQIAPILDRENS
jgi:hypothetical protein